MSAPSGIKVPDSLKSAFSSAQNDASDVRALVFVIEGESFAHHTTVQPKSTYKDDIALLPPSLPFMNTPASFAYRLDSKEAGKYEWMMVTFVPDEAGNDLTPSSLTAHLNHLASPPPLSAAEAALAEVREAEAAEAKRAALDPYAEARRKKAVEGLSGKFNWGDGVADALRKCGERSDDGWIVCLVSRLPRGADGQEIPAANPGSISLLKSESCPPSSLSSKLPARSPCYTFYSYPTPPSAPPATPKVTNSEARNTFHASEGGARAVATNWTPKTEQSKDGDDNGASPDVRDISLEDGSSGVEQESQPPPASSGKSRVLFLYTCPSGSPIKFRMVYSSGVRGIQQDAKDKAGIEIAAKLETSDISDLTESHLKSSLPSKPTHSSSLPTQTGVFGRPRPTPSLQPVRSATQIPLPASPGPGTRGSATAGDDEGKDSVIRAFDAFGPRVNAGGGGGFARPRPAGKR